MNDKCKYCDYVSECSRKCEYDSILCKIQRSFPKVIDKSYEQLKQENKHLDEVNCKLRKTNEKINDNWNKLKEYIVDEYFMYLPCGENINFTTILLDKMEEMEKNYGNVENKGKKYKERQGSDSNE